MSQNIFTNLFQSLLSLCVLSILLQRKQVALWGPLFHFSLKWSHSLFPLILKQDCMWLSRDVSSNKDRMTPAWPVYYLIKCPALCLLDWNFFSSWVTLLGYFCDEIAKSDTKIFLQFCVVIFLFDAIFECCTKHVTQNIVKTM